MEKCEFLKLITWSDLFLSISQIYGVLNVSSAGNPRIINENSLYLQRVSVSYALWWSGVIVIENFKWKGGHMWSCSMVSIERCYLNMNAITGIWIINKKIQNKRKSRILLILKLTITHLDFYFNIPYRTIKTTVNFTIIIDIICKIKDSKGDVRATKHKN